MADKDNRKIYLRIRQTSCRNAIDIVNGIFMESKSPLRISESDFMIAETIPYDGVSTFKEYMYTVAVDADPDPERNGRVADMLRGAGIGVFTSPCGKISFMVDMVSDPVSRMTELLEDYGLGRNAAKDAAERIFGMIFDNGPFDIK